MIEDILSLKRIKVIASMLAMTLLFTTQSVVADDTKPHGNTSSTKFKVDYQKFVLDNGLTVLMHKDASDPIVAFATVVHVGSNREKPGRTGFAHFFEHMSFNDSENVPMGANRKMIPELGGSRNGGTWNDGTVYYEVVPVDALDKLMWIDSDRFGYMINTVKEATLEREKQVVKNEKRQRVDNRAYGHSGHVIRKALYPKDHPYNWTVIGDLEDLQNATLEDVSEFYHQYYVPSNATLVIAGDIDFNEIKQKVKLWFGEIKAGKAPVDLKPQPVKLAANKKLYHLDNFAKLPEIRLTFPTVESYHADAYALTALASILSDGKRAPLYTTIVKEQGLAPSVSASHYPSELAGTFTIRVRANAGVKLDEVHQAIDQALVKFEKNGFDDNDLTRIKASQETAFYNDVSSVLDKALQLAIYNEFAGDADFIGQDIANILAVSKADIMRVYHQYIKDKPAVITSFVPKNKKDLVVSGSTKANVVEEKIVAGAEKQFKESVSDDFVKTKTKLDRSEPPLGKQPPVKVPDIWQRESAKGIKVLGIEHNELPLVNFQLNVEGGQWLDLPNKIGTANLLANLMNEGTQSMSAAQLEDAIGLLGASIKVSARREAIVIEGTTLAKNFSQTMTILTDMVHNPRWDEAEFARIKSRRLTAIKQNESNPNRVASSIYRRQLYGSDHIGGQMFGGDADSVNQLKLADLKAWYQKNWSVKQATLHVVGDVKPKQVMSAVIGLDTQWNNSNTIVKRSFDTPKAVTKPQVFFVDVPNAKQSVIYAGKTMVKGEHPDFDHIDMANNRLGKGTSARLTQVLRIEKGYTYGAYAGIYRTGYTSPYTVRTQVRSNVTLESLQIIKGLINDFTATFDADDLAVTKNLISKGYSRQFETLDSLLSMLVDKSTFDLPNDYIQTLQQQVQNTKLKQLHATFNQYINEQQMIYVIVGDGKTQLEKVKAFGYGEPIQLDVKGNRL